MFSSEFVGMSNDRSTLEYILVDFDLITYDQKNELKSRRNDIFEEMDQTGDELEEMKRDVEDRFEEEID